MSPTFDIRTVKSTFIFNPNSGHNARNPYLLERTREFIAHHRLNADLLPTTHPRHATELARAAVAAGSAAVISIGGDGTLNEIAQALIHQPCLFGIIPCGSGNGLGRHLGIPKPDSNAYSALLRGRVRAIDCGFVNQHAFFNVAGLGFDAEISARFNRLSRRGLLAYIKTTLKTWRSYPSENYTIQYEGGHLTTDAFIIAAANSDQYGNNCFIAPGAQTDDGLLNLTVIKNVNWRNVLPLAYRVFRGTIGSSPDVLRLTGTRFQIQRQQAAPIHTDGEVHDVDASVDIRVEPLALKVIVPAPTES